jgi:rare lipoprotein A
MKLIRNAFLGATFAVAAAATLSGPTSAATQCGTASWYELTSITASGERANPNAMTAAHPSLPFGTKVRVTNERNGRSVTVRINDRGPFVGGRIIDVTRAAANQLGFRNSGTTRVCLNGGGSSAQASGSGTFRTEGRLPSDIR